MDGLDSKGGGDASTEPVCIGRSEEQWERNGEQCDLE